MTTARAAVAAEPWRRRRVLPGFGLTLGFTLSYLTLIVLIPLLVLFIQAAGVGWTKLWAELSNPRTLAAFRFSFGTAFIAALVNAVFGVLIAWVLVRYRFPGRRFVDALIDLPFGLPTAVAGIALTSLYATTGWIGRPLSGLDLRIAFTPLGILIALVFVGLPFVVRTVCCGSASGSTRRQRRSWGRAASISCGGSSCRRCSRRFSRGSPSPSRAPSASTGRLSSLQATCLWSQKLHRS
jgi:sulfate/thiosulfate transport system permease protein